MAPIGGAISFICTGGTTYAVARYQLFDITFFLKKGVQYAIFSSVIGSTYLLIVLTSSLIMQGLLEFEKGFAYTTFIFITLLFYQPILEFAQQAVDKLFSRNRPDYEAAMDAVSSAVQNEFEAPKIIQTLLASICQILQISSCHLLVWNEKEQIITYARQDFRTTRLQALRQGRYEEMKQLAPATSLPLCGSWRDQKLGELYLEEKISEQPLTEREKSLLQSLLNQSLLAIHRADLVKELKDKEVLAKVGQCAASINHEIKNLVSPLQSCIYRVRRNAGPEILPLIENARERCSDILALTEDLRNYSRPIKLQRHTLNLSGLLNAVISDIQRLEISKNIQIVQDYSSGAEVFADGYRLRQVVFNLMKNACEAVQHQSLKEIVVGVGANNGNVQISVKDSGPGISRANRKFVFEPFKTTKGPKGTGLGLALAKKYIEAHDGRIVFESIPGNGTTFYLYLPSVAGSEAMLQLLDNDSS